MVWVSYRCAFVIVDTPYRAHRITKYLYIYIIYGQLVLYCVGIIGYVPNLNNKQLKYKTQK